MDTQSATSPSQAPDPKQSMRATFVLHAPRPDFEDVVLARLSAATWRASQVRPRKRRRVPLVRKY